ncbi:MAG: DMT family transporter [Dehalococcoidales bacterium]|nr:DMT family transporter [Dehalococcoidales bacterium]
MRLNWKSSPKIALTALVGITIIWGWSFLIVQNAIAKMPVMDFLAVRFTIAVLVMIAIRPTFFRKLNLIGWLRGIGLGIMLGLAYIFQTYGLLTVSASISGFLTGMAVVLTPLISLLLLRTKINKSTWLAVGLSCIGLALLALHGWAIGTGELLTLACALSLAFHIVGLGAWSAKYDAYSLALVQIGTVAVITLIAASPGGITLPPDLTVWGIVGITAVFASALAFLVQTWAQKLVSPTNIAVVLTMEPVFAGVFGVWLGGNELTVRIICGFVCVLAAMLIVQLKPTKAKPVNNN